MHREKAEPKVGRHSLAGQSWALSEAKVRKQTIVIPGLHVRMMGAG